MASETNYRPLSKCKSSLCGQGTELACRLFKHIGVTINRGNSSINQSGVVAELSTNAGVGVSLVMTIEPCWMDPIIDFLAEDRILADENEIEKVH